MIGMFKRRYKLTSEKGTVYGGFKIFDLQDCDEYDPDSWTNKTNLPSPERRQLAATTISNKTFVESTIDKRMSIGVKVPEWLELEKQDRKGVILRLPVRSDVVVPIEEHLIVELYSK